MKSGAPVGASTPPSGSSVTATICPGSTAPREQRDAGLLEEPGPPGHAVLEDPDLVVLALRARARASGRRAPRPRSESRRGRPSRPRSRTCARSGSRAPPARSRLRRGRSRATSPRCRARSRRPLRRLRRTTAPVRGSGVCCSGTTFERSLRACSRIRLRSDAGGIGPPAAWASAPETCQKPWSSSRQRSHEERCSSKVARSAGSSASSA